MEADFSEFVEDLAEMAEPARRKAVKNLLDLWSMDEYDIDTEGLFSQVAEKFPDWREWLN